MLWKLSGKEWPAFALAAQGDGVQMAGYMARIRLAMAVEGWVFDKESKALSGSVQFRFIH